MKHLVLQAIADWMQQLPYEDPELFEGMSQAAQQMQTLTNLLLQPNFKQAVDRITLLSGVNNLN